MATASRPAVSAWRRNIEDDTVEYFVFPELPTCSTKPEAHKLLEDMKDSYMSALQSDLEQYIWQNEPFALHIPHESGFQLVQSDKKAPSSESGKGMYVQHLSAV